MDSGLRVDLIITNLEQGCGEAVKCLVSGGEDGDRAGEAEDEVI